MEDNIDYTKPPKQEKYEYISVILRHDDIETAKNFRCIYCGKILFVYHSDVRLILDGKATDMGRPLDVLCDRCNIIYRIL